MEKATDSLYDVVINHELAYSVWPVDEALPLGWSSTGYRAARSICLDHIGQVWTDTRPLSLRFSIARRRLGGPSGPWPNSELIGYKLVDSSGKLFEAPHHFLLEKGPVAEAAPSRFSCGIEDAIADGVAAAACQQESLREVDGFPLFLPQRPRLVQVRVSAWKRDGRGDCWAPELLAQVELPLERSRLWPLLGSYLAWQEAEGPLRISAR